MRVRVITLRYDEALLGFPEEAVRQACGQGELLEVREHFFVHGNVPHLALVLLLAEGRETPRDGAPRGEDPGNALPEPLRPLYRSLKTWRNEQAQRDKVPSYVIFRNSQLVEICQRQPRSLAALREVPGVGEATCRKYGEALLALIPPAAAPAASAT